MRCKYLIVGNSAGGIGAAEAIRETDEAGSLIIVSDEPYPAYSRPLISKFLAGERTLDGMLFRPTEFYDQNSIDPRFDRKVKGVEPHSCTVELDDGEVIAWERLLLATGSRPVLPRIRGIDKKGVFTFTTIDDAKELDEFLDNASKAVVVGGGLIGISVAEALVKRNVEVTIVEMMDRVLSTILDAHASSMVAEALRQAGARIMVRQAVAEILGSSSVEGVIFDNGERLSCDLAVIAAGVAPRLELAQGAGIRTNRGVIVDRNMTTSHPRVYSCGDAAEVYDFAREASRIIPIWPNAYIGGRIAGYNMVGTAAEYAGSTTMSSLNYFKMDIAAAGVTTAPANSRYEVMSRQTDGSYRKVVLKDDLVVGMVLVGAIEKSGIFLSLIRDRVNVSDFKEALLAEDFGLAYLPQEFW